MKKIKLVATASVMATALMSIGYLQAAETPATSTAKTTSARLALPKINIPYESFTLPNGLKVIVHEDHKAPIVAVNIWYHVGSGNEPKGRSGFAHLFEHLMFEGSEHNKETWFKALEPMGATDLNGTTNTDRTNFFETVPTAALDQVLWLESDRMGYLLGAVDQEHLDQQRGVVQNEKRQGENQPYGTLWDAITRFSYPADHPYGHTVIGEMEDLNAAKMEDVQAWFKRYYGPSNAVIVLAGDIDVKTARAKMEKYFGNLPAGEPVVHAGSWVAKMNGARRTVVYDRVPQAMFVKVWNGPEEKADDSTRMQLLAGLLGYGKTSRLYQRLVMKDQIATSVNASYNNAAIGGQFMMMLTAKTGVPLAKLEAAANEELVKLLKDGPTPAELDRLKVATFANAARSLERVGGFGGKSDWLAESQIMRGSPDAYQRDLQMTAESTSAEIIRAGRTWLDENALSISVEPFEAQDGASNPTSAAADRSKLPDIGAMVVPKWEEPQVATLSNGMKIYFVPRHATPVVDIQLMFDRGDASAKKGEGALAMAMLREGAGKRNSTEFAAAADALGANISSGAGDLNSYIGISALSSNVASTLDLMQDLARKPLFNTADFERVKKLKAEQVKAAHSQPVRMALDAFAPLAFGDKHPSGRVETVSGVNQLSLKEIKAFYEDLDPTHASFIVVGDSDMATIKAQLEKRFGDWKASHTARPQPALDQVQTGKPGIYLVDKPGAGQSVILAGNIVHALDPKTEASIDAMNTVLGAGFMSRLNMNLREDKHWAYGAGGFLSGEKGPRAYTAYAPVQTDKTKESISEVRKELQEIISSRPVTATELQDAKRQLTNSLPGEMETGMAVTDKLRTLLSRDLPKDYFAGFANRVNAVTLSDAAKAASSVVKPAETIYVVVGDRTKIEAGLNEVAKAWGYGPVTVLKIAE
jgi:predicted Zn-dependent peptidase